MIEEAESFLSAGRLNRRIGWTMIVAGLAATAVLDPVLFSAREMNAGEPSALWPIRLAQGVLLAMALLQLAVGYLLRAAPFDPSCSRVGSLLTGVGAIAYAMGNVAWAVAPPANFLIVAGSLCNLLGFARLWCGPVGGGHAGRIRLILPVVCFGMLLDLGMGVQAAAPEWFPAGFLGGTEDLPQRMLRLARVAAIALAVLSLLLFDVTKDFDAPRSPSRWSRSAMLAGAVGMPVVLVLAAVVWPPFKYLLAVPATLVSFAAGVGAWVAWRNGDGLQRFGWLTIAASLTAGLVIGLYAFEGPFPSPPGMDAYQGLARRAVRIAHAYAIVVGMLALFLSLHVRVFELARPRGVAWAAGWFTILAMVMLLLVAVDIAPAWLTALGPGGWTVTLLAALRTVKPGADAGPGWNRGLAQR